MCRSPIVPLEGRDNPYNPQGDAPLPAPPSEAICKATQRSPSCSGPRPWSTRLGRRRYPGLGHLPQRSTMRLPESRTGRAPGCPTSRRTWWRQPGRWTTTGSAANSSDIDAAPGGTRTPPALLPVGSRSVAIQPDGDRPHPRLVGPLHHVQRLPGRWESHPGLVAACRTDTCLPHRILRQGAHAPLIGPVARGLAA